ncbi:unnamed protein product, partial [marine sediment metagenome]
AQPQDQSRAQPQDQSRAQPQDQSRAQPQDQYAGFVLASAKDNGQGAPFIMLQISP